MSNVLGIPNLKTDVLFNQGFQYLHCTAVGLANSRPLPQIIKKGQKKHLLIGQVSIKQRWKKCFYIKLSL
jgi:hypothetical protein